MATLHLTLDQRKVKGPPRRSSHEMDMKPNLEYQKGNQKKNKMKKFFEKTSKAEQIARFIRVLRERFERENREDYEEPSFEMLWNLMLDNEEALRQRGPSRSGTASPASSEASVESGLGDFRFASPEDSDTSSGGTSSTSSGFPPSRGFNLTPGARRPRPRNDSHEERRWRPLVFDCTNRPVPVQRQGSWSPWDGSHWTPFHRYPWHPLDCGSSSFSPDPNNNDSFFTNNETGSALNQGDRNRPASQCSELSSSASTLDTSWTSTEEEEALEEREPLPPRIPPIGGHWLVGYLRARGVGFLMPPGTMERIKAWQVVQDVMSQSSFEPWIAPFHDVENIEEEFEEKKEKEEKEE